MSQPDKGLTEKLLDRVFSIWIRSKDADHEGVVNCVTCPMRQHWQLMDCGHYRKRRHMATRWLPKNCGPQCKHCNGELQGNDVAFEKYLEETYGPGTVEELTTLSLKNIKFTVHDLLNKIKEFTL